MLILFPCLIVQAFIISKIPPSGPAPNPMLKSKATYLPNTKEILLFGGQDVSTSEYKSTLYTFNIESLVWGEIIPQSYENPPGLIYAEIFLVSENKILVFFGEMKNAISSKVYSFDLKTKIWNTEQLSGDNIIGRVSYACSDFYYKGVKYLAIYGGLTSNGIDDSFYIIDFITLKVRKIENKGDIPSKGHGITLIYYQEKLYLYGARWPLEAFENQGTSMHLFDLSTETWHLVLFTTSFPPVRFFHSAFLYKDSMLIFFGDNLEKSLSNNDTWSYNFTTSLWTNKGIFPSSTLYSSILIDTKVYVLFGIINLAFVNTVSTFDISTPYIIKNDIVSHRNFPQKRRNHCIKKINDSIYLFGGISEHGEYLNDVWRFDNKTEKWYYIITNGTIPIGRAFFGCGISVGTGILIYGGQSASGNLKDFYFYDVTANIWGEMFIGSYNPGERSKLCLTSTLYFSFIIGGVKDNNYFKDIWMYDYSTEKFTKILDLPNVLANAQCWSELNGSDFLLYVISGNNMNYRQHDYNYKILVYKTDGEYTGKILLNYSNTELDVTESALIKTENGFLLISGSKWYNFLKPIVYSYDLNTGQVIKKNIGNHMAMFGHSADHMGDSIYVFGGGFSNDLVKMPESVSNTFYKFQKEEGGIEIGCSSGTVKKGDYCEPCQNGQFYNDSGCFPCPPGTFSRKTSAEGLSSCLPCDNGYYNQKEGSLFCYECPAYSLCPIGSSYLLEFTSYPISAQNQPQAYEGKTSIISNVVNKAWLYFSLFAVFFTFAIYRISSLWKNIEMMDLFVADHGQEVDVPVVYRKTKLGGLFSIYFLLAVSIVVLGSFLTFELDNITEIKALVPLVTIKEKILANDFTIISTFYTYGGLCKSDFSGIDFLSITETNIKYKQRNTQTYFISSNCIVEINYSDIIFSENAIITIKLSERTARASYISVNITISSSIPSESSNIYLPIIPSDEKQILVGPRPSVISLNAIPSIFYSQDTKWPNKITGYHLALSENVVVGETATQKTINSKAFLNEQFIFRIGNSALVTQRNSNSSWFIFIGGLLGSVFGLFGTFTTFLGICEDWTEKIMKRLENRNAIKNIVNKRLDIHINFSIPNKNQRRKSVKILPATLEDMKHI
ncbi:hypothetical protein SteCoe_20359 [Stentor coeruleus]|uniref:Tyrosine-protein kinase ephrin type A/B receptor-like domain-containing protein n=1 Tax=Stentor coeruleus TaxID=5963 RepID=A0A1R2BS60_9CILI|nr:hypothetical protein SteCoe_20359 [Stentor coeruleus]